MSETLLLLLLIALSLNFVLGLWYAFRLQTPIVQKKVKKPVIEEKEKEETEVIEAWEPGWVGRAGPPPSIQPISAAVQSGLDPIAYVPSKDYAPLF